MSHMLQLPVWRLSSSLSHTDVTNVKGINLGQTNQDSAFPNCCQLAPAATEEIEKSRPPAQEDFTSDASFRVRLTSCSWTIEMISDMR